MIYFSFLHAMYFKLSKPTVTQKMQQDFYGLLAYIVCTVCQVRWSAEQIKDAQTDGAKGQ